MVPLKQEVDVLMILLRAMVRDFDERALRAYLWFINNARSADNV